MQQLLAVFMEGDSPTPQVENDNRLGTAPASTDIDRVSIPDLPTISHDSHAETYLQLQEIGVDL